MSGREGYAVDMTQVLPGKEIAKAKIPDDQIFPERKEVMLNKHQ
jgi:hypothetical protein